MHVIENAEQVGVDALVTQPALEALDVVVLHGVAGLDVGQAKIPNFHCLGGVSCRFLHSGLRLCSRVGAASPSARQPWFFSETIISM